MRILYLVNTLDSKNGWGRFSRELIVRFQQKGIEATILSESSSGYPGEHAVLQRSWRAIPTALVVRKMLREQQFDLIHSFEVNPYGISADLAKLGLGIPHVITATGAYSLRPLYRWTTKYLTRRAYQKAKRVLCISAYIRDEIQKVISLPQADVVTLGVDAEKFAGQRQQGGERFILSVGNLSFRKGYHVSVAAFAEVAKRIQDVKYYIAGSLDTEIYERCKKIISENNIIDRVVFLGSMGDEKLRELYLQAELFVLTSVNEDMHFEGFGLVFLEAASAGLPVIGTTGNGIRDAMEEGVNGLLVPQNDIPATTAALERLLSDSALREKFARASIQVAAKNGWDTVVQKYIDVYNETLYGGKKV